MFILFGENSVSGEMEINMNDLLERYLHEDDEAYYEFDDGRRYAQSVHGRSYLRYNKAIEQAEMDPASVESVIEIIKIFLKDIGITTAENPVVSEPLKIDYEEMKETYGLDNKSDLVWLAFTSDGYVGVVAVSDDINFDIPNDKDDYDKKQKVYNAYTKKYEDKWLFNTSGIIVHKLGKVWDESFVLVFPLKNIPARYKRGDIEHAIGNLLIENKVPILDLYSHLY